MLATTDNMLQILEHSKNGFTTPKFENYLGIFLPSNNIVKTNIHKKFLENNQKYIIKDDLYYRVTITGRLLTQKHKDVLECLFASIKDSGKFRLFGEEGFCQMEISPYNARKSYIMQGGSTTNTKWIYEKLVEISNCGVEIVIKNNKESDERIYFTFIDSIYKKDNNIIINFSQIYTYLLAKTMLIEYKDYLKPILQFSQFCRADINGKRDIEREVHTEPIRAMIRFMLSHKGGNSGSQYRIDDIFEELEFQKTLSVRQLDEIKKDLINEKVQAYLRENFGITLTNNNQTMTFKQNLTNRTKSILLPKEQPVLF